MEQTKDRKQIRAELDAAGFKNTWVWVLCMHIIAAVLIGISLFQRYKDISKNREYSYADAILIEYNQQKTYRWRIKGPNTTTRTYIKVAYTPEGSDKHYEIGKNDVQPSIVNKPYRVYYKADDPKDAYAKYHKEKVDSVNVLNTIQAEVTDSLKETSTDTPTLVE